MTFLAFIVKFTKTISWGASKLPPFSFFHSKVRLYSCLTKSKLTRFWSIFTWSDTPSMQTGPVVRGTITGDICNLLPRLRCMTQGWKLKTLGTGLFANWGSITRSPALTCCKRTRPPDYTVLLSELPDPAHYSGSQSIKRHPSPSTSVLNTLSVSASTPAAILLPITGTPSGPKG